MATLTLPSGKAPHLPRRKSRADFAQACPATAPKLPTVRCASGLSRSTAEELLDWLEMNGYPERTLSYAPQKGFTVSYRPGTSPNRCSLRASRW